MLSIEKGIESELEMAGRSGSNADLGGAYGLSKSMSLGRSKRFHVRVLRERGEFSLVGRQRRCRALMSR